MTGNRTLANVFVRRDTTLSHLIAWATRGRREGKVLATHTAKFVSHTDIVSAEFEGGVCKFEWVTYRDQLDKEGAQWCILERRDEPEPWRIQLGILLLSEMIGWKYNWGAIPLQLADGLLSKLLYRHHSYGLDAFFFRRLESWKYGIICSETCTRVDRKLGWVPDEMRYASPDELWDWQFKGDRGWKVTEYSKDWFIV